MNEYMNWENAIKFIESQFKGARCPEPGFIVALLKKGRAYEKAFMNLKLKEMIEFLQAFEADIKELKKENKAYWENQSDWVKELEKRQAKIRELEKYIWGKEKDFKDLQSDLHCTENRLYDLTNENKARKEMWEELKNYFPTIQPFQTRMFIIEQKYLGGSK